MGFIDELKRLVNPEDIDDGEDDGFEQGAYSAPAPRQKEQRPRTNPFAPYSASNPPVAAPAGQGSGLRGSRREGKVVNLGGPGGQMQVILVKPERFDTAAEVADHLRGKRAVLLNMEATPKDLARRLVDFLSGVTYAIDGNIQKVAANTYLLTPPNVDIVGDEGEAAESGGFTF